MNMVFEMGDKKILICNADKRYDVDVMLSRLAAAYQAMRAAGYQSLACAVRGCKVICASDRTVDALVSISISSRTCGIYTDDDAYHKQLARKLFRETGWEILQTNSSDADLEIGIGGLDASTQGFVFLKDALVALAFTV